MHETDPNPLSAKERPTEDGARSDRLIVAVLARWLLFAVLGLLIVLATAWPFRVELLNRFGPNLASRYLGTDISFLAQRVDFDVIEFVDIAVGDGPSVRRIVLNVSSDPISTLFIESIRLDGLRMHVSAVEGRISVTGLDLPDGTNSESDDSPTVPVRRVVLSDLFLEVDSPIGRSTLFGEVDLSLPNAPALYPLKGRVSLEDRASNSALLAEFNSSGDSFFATGTGDLSLAHWLPLAPQIAAAQGRATTRFDVAMVGSPVEPESQISGKIELAWTGARVIPKNHPEIALSDGLVDIATDGKNHAVRLPQPIEISTDRLPDFLLSQIPAELLPYADGAAHLVLDAMSDGPAISFDATRIDAPRMDFDLTTSISLGPVSAEMEPVSLTFDSKLAPQTTYIRRTSVSLLRGVDLPRDIAAHLELGALEIDLAAYLDGAFPALRLSYAMEGTLSGTILDPVWVRQATFRGEGVADLREGMVGIDLTIEPGGQIRATGLTGTGDLRLSPDLRIDVAGRDPLTLRMNFDDAAGSLNAEGAFRLGALSVALPDGEGSTSIQFGRQPASMKYTNGVLGLVLGPSDISSPNPDIAANRSVIRVRWDGSSGRLSFKSEELMAGGRVMAPGPASVNLSVSRDDAGNTTMGGPISIAGGAIAAQLDLVQSGGTRSGTRIDIASEPVAFGPGGLSLSDILPPHFIGDSSKVPDLIGQVSAIVSADLLGDRLSGELGLRIADLAIETPEGALRGLNGALTFDLAGFPATPDVQELSAMAHLPGLAAVPVSARFKINPGARVVIDEAVLSVFGGSIALIDATADPVAGNLEGTVRLRRVSLSDAVKLVDIEGVEATGVVSGLMPIRLDSGDAVIQGGSIGAEGSGVLKVDNPSVNQALASDEETVQLMTQVLKDFHYDSLTAEIDLPPEQNGKIHLSMGGRNPAVLDGHPFQLNVSLESDFRKLFSILQQALDLSTNILGRRSDG